MADGNDVKLSFNNEITINEGMKYKKILKESELKGEAKTWLKTIFDAIDSQGNTKNKTDNCELSLLEKLSQAIGGEIDEDRLEQFMAKVHGENQGKGKNLEAAIVDYLNAYTPEPEKAGTETTPGADPEGVTPGADDTATVTDNPNGEGTDTVVPVKEDGGNDDGKKGSVSVDGKSSPKAFNETIDNIVKKNGYTKTTLNNFTEDYKIQKGDNLYKIAVKTLQGQGKETPGWKEINELIAQIKVANDIKDVNRILVGQEIKLPKAGGADGADGADGAGGADGADGAGGAEYRPDSYIKIEAEFNPEGWTSFEVEGEEGITKYTKNEGEGESAVTKEMYSTSYNGITLTSETLAGLKEKKKAFVDNQTTPASENETEEDAAKRKADNFDRLRIQIGLQPTEEVLVNVVKQLKDGTLVDRDSADVKDLINKMLKTQNPEVVKAIILNESGDFDKDVFEKDRTSFETAANMFKAIRDKELGGVKLSDTEHSLKDTLKEGRGIGGFKIEADPEKGVVEKYLAMDSDGNLQYNSPTGARAADSGLLDEFVTEFKAADTDEKKAALFKKYAATTDKVLAANLAANTENMFKAFKEDIEILISNSDLNTLSQLQVKDDYKEELYKKAVEKAKELFLADKGNPANALYLDEIFDRLDESGFTEDEKSALKTEILESFFTVTTDEGGGTKTYTFEPSRRPTYEEMDELAKNATEEMREALVKSIELEDMGEKEYTAAIESYTAASVVVEHYAQLVDGMTKEEEVIDFIKNKVSYKSDIPNDKILEKFPDNQEIRELLVRNYIDNNGTRYDSIISDANRLSLIKGYINVNKDDGSWSLKDELPEGITVETLINLLPEKCDEGEARKVLDTIVKSLGRDDSTLLEKLMDHVTDPLDILVKFDASIFTNGEKDRLFNEYMTYNTITYEMLNKAVTNNWIKPLGGSTYEAYGKSTQVYRREPVIVDGKETGIKLYPISRDGYEKGIYIYKQVYGPGHREIRDILKKENYFTKDNIIGIITTFKNITEYENIIGYIDNEWGPTQAEMNVIPNTLLALAAEKGLSTDETYKELNDLIKTQTNTRSDYGNKTAKQIDDLMIELIKKIEAKRE